MPGFGRADKPRDFPYTVPGYADFLDDALAELGIDRVHLVLHDFGGPWGMEWAARNPARVASVVLINTGVLVGYRWHILARIWQHARARRAVPGNGHPAAVPAAHQPAGRSASCRAVPRPRSTT